jgi:hypothetical protein
MTLHYSTKDFFRQMPNALLARYFATKGLFGDLDFPAMTEGKPDKLFDAWLALPNAERNIMDAEFRDIFEMSCEKGFRAIIDEMRWQLLATPDDFTNLMETLSSLPNHYHRAMVTYLDHSNCWKGAIRFHHADMLPYWRKRKNMGHKSASVDEASIKRLAEQIRNYFRHTEGRGNNCVVEPFRRGDLDYFFAYPEDYSQQSIEWEDDVFTPRPHNPAFEVIFVYSQKDGSLDLNFRGSYKALEPLQSIFSTEILKLEELPPDPKDPRIYDLNPLLQKSFDFTYAVGSGIDSVRVKKMRLSSRVKKGDRITLEADATQAPDAVYDLLDQIGKSLPVNLYNVTQVELAVSMTVETGKPFRQVSVRITHPNSCSLKYDERDLKLRDMLEASGIEPKEQQAAVEPTEA